MIDKQYEDLLFKVLSDGEEKPDRTGTGTYSLFGAQLRYDLQKGFPLITTKKVHFKSVVGELLWFLSGSTDVRVLREKYGTSIWDEWEKEDGTIGLMYGHQWVNWGGETTTQRPPKLPAGVGATYLGVANGRGKEGHPLKKTWEGMIARCYDPKNIGYAQYGGRGVSVCDSWLLFENFALDAEYLPGHTRKIVDTDTRYVLDKDTRGSGLLYSLETCAWVTDRENSLAKSNTLYTLEDSEGRLHSFTNPTEFCRKVGIPNNNLSDLWTGRKNAKVRHGYRLVSTKDISGNGIDQIAGVIKSIRSDPHSRRHIVSAWNVEHLPDMALAPCHVLYQFYVSADGKRLSCHLFQRSADVFLGLPFNIASYALLTHIIASQTGLEVGELLWSGTDVHLYKNHEHQVEEQLSREVRPFPKLHEPAWTSLDGYEPSDFYLSDYNPHPAIKAPVAV